MMDLQNMNATSQVKKISATDIISNLIPEFLSHVQVSDASRKAYARSLKSFVRYLESNAVDVINQQTIIDYKTSLESRQLSVATKQNYFVAVKVLFVWLSTVGICSNFTHGIKVPKVGKTFKKKSLDTKDSAGLIESIDVATAKGKRDLAIIALMLFCGLRCVEIQRANIGDLDSKLEFLSVQGKGKLEKTDRVRIGEKLREILKSYLATIDTANKNQPLFFSTSNNHKNQRLTTYSISQIAKKALRRYGIDDRQVTAHSLRHSTATIALKQGLPIDEVSKAMRHASINTTMIYNHARDEETNRTEATIENAVFGTAEEVTEFSSRKISEKKPCCEEKNLLLYTRTS